MRSFLARLRERKLAHGAIAYLAFGRMWREPSVRMLLDANHILNESPGRRQR